MDHLSALEQESLYILREAHSKIPRLSMLWSMGKDSTALLWLTRKAFLGAVPYPLVHLRAVAPDGSNWLMGVGCKRNVPIVTSL